MENTNVSKSLMLISKLLIITLLSAFFFSFNSPQENPQKKGIVFPKGASVISLRNDNKSVLYVPGCRDGLMVDDINNLHGDNWTFYLIGKINSLEEVDTKPYCSSSRIALRAEHGYVACYSESGYADVYVRLMVTEMISNKDNEVIGATILYQTPYKTSYDLQREAKVKEELEAQKILWNGKTVPDPILRKIVLNTFDENRNGIISEKEAAKNDGLIIDDPEIKSVLGIEYLEGLTSIKIDGLSLYHPIDISLPNLKKVEIKNLKSSNTLIKISNCKSLDSIHIGHCYTEKIIVENCENLTWLDFDSHYVTNVYSLEILNCNKLSIISNLDIGGKFLVIDNCKSIENIALDRFEFNNIKIANCPDLKSIIHDGSEWRPEKYGLHTFNISNCGNLEKVEILMAYNLMKYLDLSDCTNLKELNLNCSDLKGFKIFDQNLEKIKIDNIKIKDLDFSNYPKLKQFELFNSSVANLTISQCENLENIIAERNDSLNTVQISTCTVLDTISLTYNKVLSTLIVKDCGNLDRIFCPNNNLSNLEVTSCNNLRDLLCWNNNLSSLYLADLENLEKLNCSFNEKITNLDIARNPKLKMVHCDFTKITELDISKSEQLDWVYSYEIDDYRNPLSIPFAETGFKTLWVNENQRVTVKSQSGSKSISFVDKNFNKKLLLPTRWDSAKQEVIPFTEKDLDFKIKVKK